MRRLVILVPLVLMMSGSGCFDSSTPRPTSLSRTAQTTPTAGPDAINGLFRGRATVVGGPCICPRPLKDGAFQLRSRGHVVATIRTDEQGRFQITVTAGRYRLTTNGGAPLALYPIRPRTIQVSAEHTTQVILRFGI